MSAENKKDGAQKNEEQNSEHHEGANQCCMVRNSNAERPAVAPVPIAVAICL
jgi:hypothetical protein